MGELFQIGFEGFDPVFRVPLFQNLFVGLALLFHPGVILQVVNALFVL